MTVGVFVLLAIAAWEWRMRTLELLPGDIQDSASFWAEQRRRVNTENIEVAIVGDSRILFDTDFNRFEALTGVRPLQLALAGQQRPALSQSSPRIHSSKAWRSSASPNQVISARKPGSMVMRSSATLRSRAASLLSFLIGACPMCSVSSTASTV